MLLAFVGYFLLIATLFLGFYFYKKLHPKWLKWYVWFLVITLLFEAGSYSYSHFLKRSNHFIFNTYIVIQFPVYFLIFYKSFRGFKFKTFAISALCAYLLYYLYNMLFAEGYFIFSSSSYTFGSLLVIACCLIYLVSLFFSEKEINYFKIPMFWISTAILFFFVGNSVYLSMLPYLNEHEIDSNGNVFSVIMGTLSILFYTLNAIGILSNQQWKSKK